MKNEIVKLKTTCRNNHITGVMVIHDYSKIITPEWNRKFVPVGLKNLRDSMSKNGVLTAITIAKVNNQWLVIEGNHRVKVAKENGSSITASIIDLKSTGLSANQLMIWTNITPQKWKPEDYLNNGVVYHKLKDYIKLNDLWEETSFPIPALYELYSYDSSRNRKTMFETGEWRITTEGLGNRVVRHAEDLSEFMSFYNKTNFLKALVSAVSTGNYSEQHMLQQAKRYKSKIYDSGDGLQGHKDMLHNLYNWKALDEERLVLNVGR